MRLCYSEYEKFFIRTVYNSSCPRGEMKTLWANLASSYKEAPTPMSWSIRTNVWPNLSLCEELHLYSKILNQSTASANWMIKQLV